MTKLNLLVKKALLFAVFNFFLTFPFHSSSKYYINEENSPTNTFSVQKVQKGESDSQLVIVIDPGHGGKDVGTSYEGIREKDVVLEISKALKRKIEAALPMSKVVLTRESDVFVPLHSRITVANNLNADLFLSVHCNSFIEDRNVNGSEIHVLGLGKNPDKLNTALRENASILFESDHEKNYDWHDPDSPEAHIFLSAFQNLFLGESIDLAVKFSRSNQIRPILKQRGVKQSGLLVLRNAAMPALLIETGYLSNGSDRSIMNMATGQNQIASWIANVLMEHFIFDKRGLVMNKS
ncbi:MAG: N-acetylmuramoyl-L-alanine amidase [Saprospiraceae bacterium]|nr:N-acetylmuramoyl-L-alanine amidase [Saprospiraceae bacterium]